jgi:acetyl esterase
MALEPTTQAFIDSLSGPQLYELDPAAAHKLLTDLQSKPIELADARIEDTIWPVGPTGATRIRIVRPAAAAPTDILPLILYFHGGGWVLGDKITHDRLVREIANGAGAAVVFVDYVNAPEAKCPTQQEQAYASMVYAVEHARELHVDASRLAVAGDSVGGHMVAVVTLMAKLRSGPKIRHQVLFYPLLDYLSDNESYRRYANGPWLTAANMKWMFDLEGLDGKETDGIAWPARASIEQLRGLPDATIIVDDDILRDEGEAYANKLSEAGVRVTSVRYNETIHDFVMLNPLARTPAVRAAIGQAIDALKDALAPAGMTRTTDGFLGNGGVKIVTRAWRPAAAPRGAVIIVHGFNAHSGLYEWPAEQLVRAGFAVHALDLRGRGKSGGERFYVQKFDDWVDDVARFVDIVKEREPGLPVFMLGHSAGGVIACTYALGHGSELAGLVCESFAYQVPAPQLALRALEGVSRVAPHAHVLPLRNKDFSRDPKRVAELNADPLIAHEIQPARTMTEMLHASERLGSSFARITLPLFIIHGTEDNATKPSGSKAFYDRAGSKDKSLKLYEGHVHDLLADLDKEIVMADIVKWLDERT